MQAQLLQCGLVLEQLSHQEEFLHVHRNLLHLQQLLLQAAIIQ